MLELKPRSVIGAHRSRWIAVGAVLAAALVLVALWPRTGTSGFTGVAVTVPSCPPDVDGCRVFVKDLSNSGSAHADWSGAATTLKIGVPAGRYALFAEGCAGDRITGTTITVSSGFHQTIDLGESWDLVAFLGRTCPGFAGRAP